MGTAVADRILAHERKYEKELQRLIQTLKAREISIDEPLVWDAFYFAADAHRGQTRFSGEPYISHPVAVVGILAEYTIPDSEMLAAALLHDVLEDTPVEPTELLAYFGETIFSLVKGLTKLSRYVHVQDEELRAQNLRKFFFETVHDLRVLLIKLADRLHNLMTLDYLPDEEKRKRIAQDTFDFYAPLAHRFGFYRLKSLLEDEAFRNTNPGAYETISRRLDREREKKDERIARLKRQLEDALRRKFPDMKSVIHGRFKHIYSIHQKMTEQQLSFEEVRDLYGLRIVVPTEEDCYLVLALVHDIWSHIQGYFRDYIGSPKPNGYRSLHTMMIASDGDPIEVQIRSFEMDRLAEFGVAAHWFYKNGAAMGTQLKDFTLIREILNSGDYAQSPKNFLEALKMEVFQQEIFVYTPKGDKVYLPRGATPLDFAYKIHTEVGNRYAKAQVNGRAVPVDTELRLGDSVEIITLPDAEPQPYWLNFVKTPSAQFKIRSYLKKRERAQTLQEGRKVLEEEILRHGLHDMNLLRPSLLEDFVRERKLKDVPELYKAVMRGEVVPREAIFRLLEMHREELKKMVMEEKLPAAKTPRTLEVTLKEAGLAFPGVRETRKAVFPKCCYPVRGDKVVAIQEPRKIVVHRDTCREVDKATRKRALQGDWIGKTRILYPSDINIIAPNRRGLLKDIITVISDQKTNILSNTIKLYRKDLGSIRFLLEVKDVEHLDRLMKAIRKGTVDVLSVERTLSV